MKVKIDFYLKDGREVSTFAAYDSENSNVTLKQIAMNIENTISSKREVTYKDYTSERVEKEITYNKYFMGQSEFNGAVIMIPFDNISYFTVNELL